MAQLTLSLFGSPLVEQNNQRIPMVTGKTTALLVYLAVTQQRQSRQSLMALLWPNSDTKRARASLRRSLADLKKTVGAQWVQADGEMLYLDPEAMVQVDVWQFQQLLATEQPTNIAQASQLYADDFLAGFNLPDAPLFDEWLFFERETLRQQLAQALEKLIQWQISQGSLEEAIPYSRQYLALDPLHESAHVQLMHLYAHTGQTAAALRQYDLCQQVLMEELGLEPLPETTELYQQIRSRRFQRAKQRAKPTLLSNNLPALATSFIGREQELTQIKEKLDAPHIRLLTLHGLGGVGKTRLALQVAQQNLELFQDGVWYVDLVGLSSQQGVVYALAQTLMVSLQGIQSPKQQLIEAIKGKKMLLVFDNFEHLLDQASLLSELLSQAPQIKLLVTSREVLQLKEEWVYEVKGLGYPEHLFQENSSLLNNGRSSAIQLFMQRARQVHQGFDLTTQHPSVVRICQLVEGMPLAIELATAWVRMLSCEQIATEIQRNLDFLTSTQQNRHDRHRSIRATFAYSWQLLSTAEQTALKNLSVFPSSFTTQAAEAVADVPLYVLFSLHNKSLIQTHSNGRYRLHELLRQFIAEKQTDPEPTLEKLTDYYTTFLSECESDLFGGKQTETIQQIKQEIKNVYQAWHWGVGNGRFEALNQAFHSLYNYHAMQSLYAQGEQLFHYTLSYLPPEQTNPSANHLRVRLMARRGEYLYMLSELSQAETQLKHALSLAQQLQMEEEIEMICQILGVVAYLQGEYEPAKVLLSKALEMAVLHGNTHREAYIHMTLGAIEQALGNHQQANQQHQTSLALYQELDYQWGIAHSLRFLGVTAYHLGDHHTAQTHLQRSLHICQTIENKASMAMVLNALGNVSQALENPLQAYQQYQKSLTLSQESQVHLAQVTSLRNLGRVASLYSSQKADGYIHLAFQLAVKTESIPVVLDVLLDMATQLSTRGEHQKANALVEYIETHPATHWKTQQNAKQMFAQLETNISSQRLLTTGG